MVPLVAGLEDLDYIRIEARGRARYRATLLGLIGRSGLHKDQGQRLGLG